MLKKKWGERDSPFYLNSKEYVVGAIMGV